MNTTPETEEYWRLNYVTTDYSGAVVGGPRVALADALIDAAMIGHDGEVPLDMLIRVYGDKLWDELAAKTGKTPELPKDWFYESAESALQAATRASRLTPDEWEGVHNLMPDWQHDDIQRWYPVQRGENRMLVAMLKLTVDDWTALRGLYGSQAEYWRQQEMNAQQEVMKALDNLMPRKRRRKR